MSKAAFGQNEKFRELRADLLQHLTGYFFEKKVKMQTL